MEWIPLQNDLITFAFSSVVALFVLSNENWSCLQWGIFHDLQSLILRLHFAFSHVPDVLQSRFKGRSNQVETKIFFEVSKFSLIIFAFLWSLLASLHFSLSVNRPWRLFTLSTYFFFCDFNLALQMTLIVLQSNFYTSLHIFTLQCNYILRCDLRFTLLYLHLFARAQA